MPQKIYIMYHEIKKKEESNSAMILTRISQHKQTSKVKKLKDSRDKKENNQLFLKIMNTPSDLNDIQPISNQVWNYD